MAMPSGKNGPGLIVIHGILGLNANMRALCDELAAEGYMALCPDLFARQHGTDKAPDLTEHDGAEAAMFYKNFDMEAGVRDLMAALAHLRQTPGCGGKVGALGFCLGGRLAFMMAARSDVDCTVGYDNVGIETLLSELHDIRMPLLLHFGEQDKLVPPPVRDRILKRLQQNKVITAHLYAGADHAFARKTGQKFHPESAALANKRTKDFLNEHLKG
jgi:carboxymethylenebutenolidase